jgi:cohesin complex subunit SCC1
MHWKETGGVEKLFALPGRLLHSQPLFKHYQRNLTAKPAEDENVSAFSSTVRGGGGDFFPFRIPDPNCLHPGSASKNLSILTPKKPPKKTKKWFLSSRKYDPDADFLPSLIPDPAIKRAPDPGSGSATLVGDFFVVLRYVNMQNNA